MINKTPKKKPVNNPIHRRLTCLQSLSRLYLLTGSSMAVTPGRMWVDLPGYILDPILSTGLKPTTKHPKIPNHSFRNLLRRMDIGHKIINYVM